MSRVFMCAVAGIIYLCTHVCARTGTLADQRTVGLFLYAPRVYNMITRIAECNELSTERLRGEGLTFLT